MHAPLSAGDALSSDAMVAVAQGEVFGFMEAQAIVWFLIAAVAGGAAVRLFIERFITKKPTPLHSSGGTLLFAICLLLSAIGALAAGFITAS
jgi:hypothetical protein